MLDLEAVVDALGLSSFAKAGEVVALVCDGEVGPATCVYEPTRERVLAYIDLALVQQCY
jgi:hypothetical protein